MILSCLAQFLRLTTSSSSSAPTPHPIFRHPLGLVPLTPGSPTETLWPRTSLKKCGHSGPDVTRLGLQYVVSSLCLATFKSRSFLLPSNSRACVLRYKVVLLVILAEGIHPALWRRPGGLRVRAAASARTPSSWTFGYFSVWESVLSYALSDGRRVFSSTSPPPPSAGPRPWSFRKAAFAPRSQVYVSHHLRFPGDRLLPLLGGMCLLQRGNFRPLE